MELPIFHVQTADTMEIGNSMFMLSLIDLLQLRWQIGA